MFDATGLDTARACAVVEGGQALTPGSLSSDTVVPCQDVFDLISRAGAASPGGRAALLETTTLDVERGEPATSHLLAALDAGLHAITANKGPVACRYDEVAARACAAGRAFRFEGAVMDGIPIFNLARETLRGVEVRGLRGIVNSTTQFILAEMEAGRHVTSPRSRTCSARESRRPTRRSTSMAGTPPRRSRRSPTC